MAIIDKVCHINVPLEYVRKIFNTPYCLSFEGEYSNKKKGKGNMVIQSSRHGRIQGRV